ncbi:homocysteine S-methyltransferase family protein [Sinorhizobium meliloti]|uniref:homocysteine S-methyltransferase family protein n=1 Tax=Rhizobium meliloti TaxID=382 RepID=UPI0013E3D2A3|nr:homocysteine S-methyltransferase family protein [Sinorhizobium meliloti]
MLGPAGDGYAPEQLLTPTEAARLHSAQLETFAEEGVDITSAFTITHPSEAIGMVNRARSWPAFRTVIHGGDRRAVADWAGPRFRAQRGRSRDWRLRRYYGINCAHPEHFGEQLPSRWLNRIGMVRPNASRRSHAELDEATELDDGDPQEFALR